MPILYLTAEPTPRLRAVGPWAVCQVRKAAWMGPAGSWPDEDQLGEVQTSPLDGLRYRVLRSLPPLATLRRTPAPPWTVTVDLPGLPGVPVAPALGDGLVVRPDGTLDDRPASVYARAARALFERLSDDEQVPITDPAWWRLAFLALATTHRLTEDLLDAYAVLTTATIPRLCEAAWASPKA